MMVRRRTARREFARGLSLVEVMVAGLIVAIAIPPLVTHLVSIWRAEHAQVSRSHGTNVAHIVYETVHHRMYNGYRTDPARARTLRDTRNFKLNEVNAERWAHYRGRHYFAFFDGLKESESRLVSSGSGQVSGFFDRLIQAQGEPPRAITREGAPELADSLKDLTLTVDPSYDPGQSVDVDMASMRVEVRWKNTALRTEGAREFHSRYTRYLYEEKPLNAP